ncbi:TetR family transcriptional regulator [Pseudonocardia autotrophica]|uniref:Bacterial regulatory protein n=2 Tax=Pseudonocardia TaxID=1847 RepID=A0A1Y2N504_PSEAH|nr:TetR/AcrR family transcriptional regulator [Pseudonocardia autotrophica]OSY42167.1 Bacterial regulatory protein [Pseudonocardia autotrophica]TDN75065.1 TetR family transcriptional regulator [Pseudonocardia autotrophica]
MSGGGEGLRSDAALNRTRILEAARAAFALRGIDVPMAAIARRAGVGVATLFRRFPTKQALVSEVFAEQVKACELLLETALADPDPWRGFCDLLESVRAVQIRDRGFTQAFLSAHPDAGHAAERAKAERDFAEVVRRAQAVGRLRADFSPHDLPLIMLAQVGITTTSSEIADVASRRLLAYLLQSFAVRPDDGPARSLPSPPEMDLRAVIELPADGRE